MTIAATALVVACGGGGGGGGGDAAAGSPGTNSPSDFVLKAAFIGRPVLGVDGTVQDVLNPASLYEVDPVTGVVLPGFPKPLTPGTDLSELEVINFAQVLDPITPQVPLVPRNAAIVLEYNFAVDADSLLLDDSDPDAPGKITAATPIQVRRADGSLVEARASVDGRFLTLFALSPTQAGWEASPLVFDSLGNAVEDPAGHLRIVMGSGVGLTKFLSIDGKELVAHEPDHLGTLAVPLPFNPGNSGLDPLALQTDTGVIGFNGFLPDLTAPRIVRPVVLTGIVDPTPGSVNFGAATVRGSALAIPANTVANGGAGEWARALLEIVGVGGKLTSYVVATNTSDGLVPAKPVFHLESGTVIDSSVVPGSAYTVTRTEFFEPIPPPLPPNPAALADITVDPQQHPRDPFDPQDLINHDLRYFVRMFDEDGDERTAVWNPAENLFGPVKGKFNPIPPRTTVRIQFSEPMEPSSFRPYESFYVTPVAVPKTDPAFQQQRVGRSVASDDLRVLAFEPFIENQFIPGDSAYIGFGGTPSNLKLVMRTIPEAEDLDAILSSATPSQLAQFFELETEGVQGIIDLGGRGLGLPQALLDQGNPNYFLLQPGSPGRGAFPPAVDFSVSFQTQPSADPDFGAVVHRFMGQATSSSFQYLSDPHDVVTTGIEYNDWPPADEDNNGTIDRHFIYGPTLLDCGLGLPGRLTGAPASTLEHLIDDFNKPKPAPFSSPQGQDVLSTVAFGLRTPLNSPYGCRFQHVYRPGEASPAYNDFNGVTLDLVGLAWAPLGNAVTNENVEDLGILVGLSAVNNAKGPNTNENQGIPAQDGNTGLRQNFDCNLLEWAEICATPLTDNIDAELEPFIDQQPHLTEVVRKGTNYTISGTKLFKPGNAINKPPGQFNFFLNYPTFNGGVDTTFGKSDVRSFPYDSRFPMIVEYHIEPATNVFPSNSNAYRFSPAIFSSVLPRFRIWSQGQHPLTNCVPNFGQGCPQPEPPPPLCGFKAGEGGPLLEPGSFFLPIKPPSPKNNQMPTLIPKPYILPPNQPEPDAEEGTPDCATLPTCNSDPDMNWYFGNGMNAFPLPDFVNFPGPQPWGFPPTDFFGYGLSGLNPPFAPNEPGYNCNPGGYGDNARYYMMWKYRKRISVIQSPTVEAQTTSGTIQYRHPIIDPPLSSVSDAAGLRVEFRSSSQINFAVESLESGYVLPTAPDFLQKLSGPFSDRVFVKFRATFAVATGLSQPPSIDSIVIPYEITP